MNLTRFFLPLAILSSMAGAAIAQTNECDTVVLDNANVISDVGKVDVAAQQFGNAGATVRVRTIGTEVPPASLDDYAKNLRLRCPTWRSGSEWRSTMVLFAFAPRVGNQVGLYYGPGEAGKLGGGRWQDVLRTNFVPQLQAYNHGDKTALTEGFVNTLTELTALVSRPSTGGNVVINQASDHRGLWKVLGWLVVGLFAFGIFLAAALYMRARDRRRSAQAEVRRVRSQCVTGILEITDDTDYVVLQSGIATQPDDKHDALNRKLTQYKHYGVKALDSFSTFDNMSGHDPNDVDMPIEGYRNNQSHYGDIIKDYIAPARRLRREIEAGDISTTPQGFVRGGVSFISNTDVSTVGAGGGGGGIYQQAQLAPSTVIVQGGSGGDGFVTGMFLGDAMARASDAEAELRAERRRRDNDYVPPPTYPDSSPSRDSGGSYSNDDVSTEKEPPLSDDDDEPSSDSGGSFSSSC